MGKIDAREVRILITGRGTSGSWQIRAKQLGAAIGARVEPEADRIDCDLAILVKRTPMALVHRLRKVPVVYDVVDGWPQPSGNSWTKKECMAWLRTQVEQVKPAGIVAATRAMAEDCAEFGIPVLWLPHHARPLQARNPIREHVQTVGYEGGPQYLGRWHAKIEKACQKRGWKFVVNPPSLADLDIVVGVRDQTGYAPMHWKSGIKLANAQGSGTPCVMSPEHGYIETASGAEFWAESIDEMESAFDAMKSRAARVELSERLYSARPKLEKIAQDYKAWLTNIAAR